MDKAKTSSSTIITASLALLGAIVGALGLYYGGERAAKVVEISATATAEIVYRSESPNPTYTPYPTYTVYPASIRLVVKHLLR